MKTPFSFRVPVKNPCALAELREKFQKHNIPIDVYENGSVGHWVVFYMGKLYCHWLKHNPVCIVVRDEDAEKAYRSVDAEVPA